jgi:hypothetical protein
MRPKLSSIFGVAFRKEASMRAKAASTFLGCTLILVSSMAFAAGGGGGGSAGTSGGGASGSVAGGNVKHTPQAEKVNKQVDEMMKHPPCGAPGTNGNPKIAITPETQSC